MEENNKCPLCGKEVKEDESFCQDCRNMADNSLPIEMLSPDVLEDKKENDIKETSVVAKNKDSANFYEDVEKKEFSKQKSSKKTWTFIIVGLALLILVGAIGSYVFLQNKNNIETEITYWNKCLDENSQLAYSKYLVQYPEGKFSEQAYSKIDSLRSSERAEWESVRNSSSVDTLLAFLKDHPGTSYTENIHNIADSLAWQDAIKANTAEIYQAYLENIKSGSYTGKYKTEAQEKYDYLSQMKQVDGENLIHIKKGLVDFYKALSSAQYNDVQKMMTPVLVKFYEQDSLPVKGAVELIKSNLKKNNANRVTYSPIVDSMQIIQDNKGIYIISLPLKTEISRLYLKKVKVEKKGKKKKVTQKDIWLEKKEKSEDVVGIELNAEKLLQALYKKDK